MLLIICCVAFASSVLTFFSGFGLGTILTPVFAIFFPVEIAVSLTAIVHLLNNLFKMMLVGVSKERDIIIRFGIPSVITSFIGAWTLSNLAAIQASYSYHVGEWTCSTTPVKISIAALMLIFTLFEILPGLKNIQFDKRFLPFGGLISGFVGGLSGNQGALRSMFLIKAGLTKESFISTGILIACMVDFARIPVYSSRYFNAEILQHKWLVLAATLSAFAGAYLGNKFFRKITLSALQVIVSIALILIALLLGTGVI